MQRSIVAGDVDPVFGEPGNQWDQGLEERLIPRLFGRVQVDGTQISRDGRDLGKIDLGRRGLATNLQVRNVVNDSVEEIRVPP